MVLQVLDLMKLRGQPPNAVTYGCLLLACQHQGNIDGALDLYRQASFFVPIERPLCLIQHAGVGVLGQHFHLSLVHPHDSHLSIPLMATSLDG